MSQLLRRTPSVVQPADSLYGHTGFVEDLLALSSGVLVSVDSNGEVIVWNTETQRPRQQFSVSTSPLKGVGAIPGTEDIAVWGWDGSLLRLSVPDLTGIVRVELHDDRILNARFGFVGDRRVAATASMDNTAALVDIDSGELLFRTDPHGFWVIDAYIWHDLLVTVSRDGTVRLFSDSGEFIELFSLEGGHFVSAGMNDGRVVAASIDGDLLRVDLEKRTSEVFLQAVRGEPAVIGFDDGAVVIGDIDGKLTAIDVEFGEPVATATAHGGGVLGGTIGNGFVVSFGLDRKAVVSESGTLNRVREIDAHDNLIGTAAFIGEQLATGSADSSVKLHDPRAESTTTRERHNSLVTGMMFESGRLISWGYNDPVARAWDPGTGKVVARREGHVRDVASVSKFGERWVSTSHDGTARVSQDFDGTNATVLGLANGVRDGAITGPTTVALGMMTGLLIHLDVDHGELWRFDNGEEIFEVSADRTTETVAFTDKENVCLIDESGALVARLPGKAFFLGDGALWVFGTGTVIVYDVVSGETTDIQTSLGKVEKAVGNRWGIVAIDSGGRVAAFESDGSVRWETRPVERSPSCVDLTDDLLSLGWHNAGAAALDIRNGEVVLRDDGDPEELIVDVAGHPDSGRLLVVAWDQVRLHDIDSKRSWAIGGLDPRPDAAWFLDDAVWITAFGHTLYRWYPADDELAKTIRHDSIISGLATLDDGRLVSWGWDGRIVVDSVDGRFQRDWGGHGAFVYGAAELPDEGLVTWSFDATARVWDERGSEREVFRTRTRGIEGGARSGDTIWLGTSAGELYGWTPKNRRVMLFEAGEWHRGPVKWLVGHDEFVASVCRSGRLGIWSSETLSNVAFWDVPESGGFASLAVDDEGMIVAAGGERGRIIAVDPVEGRVLFDIAAHGASVRGLAFAPDLDVLYSVSGDGTIAAWNRAGELLDRTRLDGEGYSVAAGFAGLVAAGDVAGRVLFFDFATEVH